MEFECGSWKVTENGYILIVQNKLGRIFFAPKRVKTYMESR